MIWILVAVVALLLVVVGVLVMRQGSSARLRKGFGPEYDRAVDEHTGDRRSAEADLRSRRERRRSYDIRELEPAAKAHYAEQWEATQRRFVDQPATALREADGLVGQVMRDRGYPVEDFDRQAEDLSVDHPGVVEHYREGHAIQLANAQENASTEDLRQALVHYRALFDELLGDERNRRPHRDRPDHDRTHDDIEEIR